MNKQYGEFVMGNVFEKLNSKYIGNQENKKKDVSKIKSNEFCVPLVYAKSGDNGIMYWAKENTFNTFSNILSIIYNGAIAAGLVYAHKQDTGVLAESYFIRVKGKDIPFECYLYLKTIIQKSIFNKYSRDYLATWDGKVENDIIYLPVKRKRKDDKYVMDDIDFNYMESYVLSIMKTFSNELKKYLESIEHYLLDYNVLDVQEFDKNIKFGKFNYTHFYKVLKVKNVLSKYDCNEDGVYDVYSSESTNNGIIGKSNYKEFCIDCENKYYVIFGDHTRTFNIAKKDFSCLDNVKVLKPLFQMSIEQLLYINVSWKKQIKDLGYARHWSIAKDCDIPLPLKENAVIQKCCLQDVDFDYMEKYIKYLKMKVLKNIKDYSNKLISKTS